MTIKEEIGVTNIVNAIGAIMECEKAFDSTNDIALYINNHTDLGPGNSQLILQYFFSKKIIHKFSYYYYVDQEQAKKVRRKLMNNNKFEKPDSVDKNTWICIKEGEHKKEFAISDHNLHFDVFGYSGRVIIKDYSGWTAIGLSDTEIDIIGPRKQDIPVGECVSCKHGETMVKGHVFDKPLIHRCWHTGKDLYKMGYTGILEEIDGTRHHILAQEVELDQFEINELGKKWVGRVLDGIAEFVEKGEQLRTPADLIKWISSKYSVPESIALPIQEYLYQNDITITDMEPNRETYLRFDLDKLDEHIDILRDRTPMPPSKPTDRADDDGTLLNDSQNQSHDIEEKITKSQEMLDRMFKQSFSSGYPPHKVARIIIGGYTGMLPDSEWFKEQLTAANKIGKESTRYMQWMKASELLEQVRKRAKGMEPIKDKMLLQYYEGKIADLEENIRDL